MSAWAATVVVCEVLPDDRHGPERVLGPEELAGLFDLGGRPPPAVLDTACVRIGLAGKGYRQPLGYQTGF